MPNYFISPETREMLRQAREELDRREQALAEQNQVPPRVAAFWNAEEADVRRGGWNLLRSGSGVKSWKRQPALAVARKKNCHSA